MPFISLQRSWRVTSGPQADRNHRPSLVSFLEADESLEEQIKMASQEESVREFVAVTDVDEERARFFLESAGWNLQVGLFCVSASRCGGLRGEESEGSGGDTACVTRIARPANISPCCR